MMKYAINAKFCNISLDDKSEMEYVIAKAIEYIQLWKAHQLRSVNQDKCRMDILNVLDETIKPDNTGLGNEVFA